MILVLKPILSFYILSPVQNDIDAFRRIGPEITFGTVPQFPQKVGPKLLCLLKGHFPLLMFCKD